MYYALIILLLLVAWRLWRAWAARRDAPPSPMPAEWVSILERRVGFYTRLPAAKRKAFRQRVMRFLQDVRVTGISTEVSDEDRLLVAASAVIPIFGFPQWRYRGLREVLLYPGSFNQRYETAGPGRTISGQVGGGVMGGKVILSRPALHQGFANETSKSHVGIHEFVHLLDKADGLVDGIPEALLEKQYAIPWMKLMQEKITLIRSGKADINPYGGTQESEFFPVVSEYFFKRPDLLKRKYPALYAKLERIFRQDPAGFA
jgi:Mlc titration factor MtfA (ptsG expression regulator)